MVSTVVERTYFELLGANFVLKFLSEGLTQK